MVAKQKSRQPRGARRVKQSPLPLAPEARRELLLLGEVIERTRISDRTLSRLEKAGRFPKRVKIGFKRIAWRAADIDAWIAGDAAGAVAPAAA
jgi:prophage regulatory protein